MKNKIPCLICGEEFKRITRTHLKKHGLTTEEYKHKFPRTEIVSEKLSFQLGKKFREDNPMHQSEIRNLISNLQRGRKLTLETRKLISKAKSGKSWGRHTKEHKEYMSKLMKIVMKQLFDNGIVNLPEWTNERREEQSQMMQGNNYGQNGHHNKGQKLDLTDEQRKNRSAKRVAYLSQNGTNKTDTNIELNMKLFLMSNNINFKFQYPLEGDKGSWLFDFYLPEFNMLLEIDGEYYHSKKAQITRDQHKEKQALKLGYKFLRISDNKWKPELIFADQEKREANNRQILENRIACLLKEKI